MNIKRLDNTNKDKFGDLKVGDVFEYNNELFLRIATDWETCDNVLSLSDYTTAEWYCDTRVTKMDSELIVKEG